jgi:hypothetical protein
MQSFYPEQFQREMGCTEAEWLRWLPEAIGTHAWQQVAQAVEVQIDAGQLMLNWQTSVPRVLGLTITPRLLVSFHFEGLGETRRNAFMKRFDLYMQRGGG